MPNSRNRKPRNDLHALINSMTGHEKRFFKLSSRQAGEKKYLALFDAVAAQKEYDEEEIKEKFKGENLVRHLPAEKNHLYNLILKSLRDYHTNVERTIADLQHNASILTNKGLYVQAERALKKGLALAEKIGHHTAAAEIAASQWNMMMDHAESIDEFEKRGSEALARATDHLESRITLLTLVQLNAQLSIHKAKNNKNKASSDTNREFYRTLLEHPALAEDINYPSLPLGGYYHLVRGSCYQYLENFEQAWKEKKELVRISREILTYDSGTLKNYLSAVQNYANAAVGLLKPEALETLVEQIRSVSTAIKLSVQQEALLFSKAAMIELQRLFVVHGKEKEERKNIPTWISETVDGYGKHLRNVVRFHICFVASVLLSLRINYHDVLEWSERGLHHAPDDSHNERRLDLYLMRGIALYELGETEKLDSQLRLLKRLSHSAALLSYQRAGLEALESIQEATSDHETSRIVKGVLEEQEGVERRKGFEQRNPILYWLGKY